MRILVLFLFSSLELSPRISVLVVYFTDHLINYNAEDSTYIGHWKKKIAKVL